MAQESSPRGTYLKVAEVLKAQVRDHPEMVDLPTVAEVMQDHGVSRGVVLRVFEVLRKEGIAEPVPGSRWRVTRDGSAVDRRPMADRLADVIVDDALEVGAEFPSSSVLCERFGVSRPTMRRALDRLESQGLLTEGGQGKVRRVRALPSRKESATS